jgi:hypothetical protein
MLQRTRGAGIGAPRHAARAGGQTVTSDERAVVVGLLALATLLYVTAWLFGGPATFPDLLEGE